MMIINKDKRIGNVIFIVEGKKTESKIIRDVFNKIFGFTVYQNNKNEDLINLKKDKDKYSKIFIIINEKPQLSTELNETMYIENIFQKLVSYNLNPYESAIYYIFDRDYNDINVINTLINKLSNSRENDNFDLHGLLLLSYPCIESFYMNCRKDHIDVSKSAQLKSYVRQRRYKNINKELLLNGINEFMRIIDEELGIHFSINDLDSFQKVNSSIFEQNEMYFNETNCFKILSLFFISLIDLGLIEFKE